MTENFEFEERQLDLEIKNQTFRMWIDENTAALCMEILADARERLAALKSGSKEFDTSEEGICRFFKTSIKKLLKSDEVEDMFAKVRDIGELADILCFIAAEIRKVFLAMSAEEKSGTVCN